MKHICTFFFILLSLSTTSYAYEDGYFFMSLTGNVGHEGDRVSVNIRNPSEPETLSLQKTFLFEIGQQSIFTESFGTDFSIVSRSSSARGGADNALVRIFDCFFGLLCDSDGDSTDFDGATFNPVGLHILPFYHYEKFQLGAGLSLYNNKNIRVQYDDESIETLGFKRAVGFIAKGSFYLTDWLALIAAYENVEFRAKDNTLDANGNIIDDIDGSHFSLGLRARF